MTISAVFIVHNEALRIRAALADIKPFVDEIVVVDQGSTDDTKYIARELADVIVEHPCHGYCEVSRPAAVAAASGEWILALDADERLTDYGKANLRDWTTARVGFYFLRRLTTVDGLPIEDMAHGRLFRRSKANIPTTIHTCYTPRNAREATIEDEVVIEHAKTTIEQRADDLRYVSVMGDQGYIYARTLHKT